MLLLHCSTLTYLSLDSLSKSVLVGLDIMMYPCRSTDIIVVTDFLGFYFWTRSSKYSWRCWLLIVLISLIHRVQLTCSWLFIKRSWGRWVATWLMEARYALFWVISGHLNYATFCVFYELCLFFLVDCDMYYLLFDSCHLEPLPVEYPGKILSFAWNILCEENSAIGSSQWQMQKVKRV